MVCLININKNTKKIKKKKEVIQTFQPFKYFGGQLISSQGLH